MTPPVKRLSRVEQQERTRQALLDAAIELFIERGIDATSIEEVAAAAGFTRGAFYSNFTSKGDLFLEATKRFLRHLHDAARPPADAHDATPGDAYLARLVRVRGVVGDRPSVFLAEAVLYVIRHPELEADFARLHQEQLEPAMEFVRGQLHSAGITRPRVPLAMLANIAQTLMFGLHLFSQIDPEVQPEEALRVAMELLVAGLAPRRARPAD